MRRRGGDMRRRDFMLGLAGGALARAASAATSPVVLELFTSQGCSSCPPADALLGRVIRRPDVIALAWHVDYWNGLGWHDPFATRFSTDRQRAYAAALGDEVYTPALVVNGGAVVVGSDAHAVEQAIARAQPFTAAPTLRRQGEALVADLGAVTGAYRALLACYDAERETSVGAGENSGRHLREYRIVRRTEVLTNPEQRITLKLPEKGQGAVLLLQDAALRVIGAAELPASGMSA